MGAGPKRMNVHEGNVRRVGAIPRREDSEIDMSALDVYMMPPPPPPPPGPSSPPPPPPPPPRLSSPPPTEIVINPTVAEEKKPKKPSLKPLSPHISAKSFTVASLQQFTNSFSQENLIGSGMLGSVYRAELPDGKVKSITCRGSSRIQWLVLIQN